MAASTKRKTQISIKKDQDQREPAGRLRAGGIGAEVCAASVVGGTGRSGLGESQFARGGVVIENFRIAPPLDGGFQLAARFVLAEMLVEQVAEEFLRERAVRLRLKGIVHLGQQWNVRQRRFAKNRFAGLDVRLGEGVSFRSDDRVAFFEAQQAEQHGRVHCRKKRVHFEAQFIREFMEIRAAALIHENLQQTGHPTRTRVGKHDGFARHLLARASGLRRNRLPFVVRARKDAINFIDKLDKARGLSVTRMGHVHGNIRVNMGWITAKNDDAVGKNHSFFDIVRDDENGPSGNLSIEPKLQKLAAQRFRGQNIQSGKRFIHEENFRFDDEGAGDTDALLHAAGEFLGISSFETVQPDRVNDAQRAFVALDGNHAPSLERGFDIFEYREPREKSKALKHDGNVWRLISHRLAVPENRAGAGGRESREHAKQRGFSAAGGTEQRDDLPGVDGEVRGGNHLNAAAVRLRVIFFEFPRFDDGRGSCARRAHESVYYRSTWRGKHRRMKLA